MSDKSQDGVAWFEVTGEMLAELFLFAGCSIDRIDSDTDSYNFRIRIKGPGLPPWVEGCIVERITPTYEMRCVQAGDVAPERMEKVRMKLDGEYWPRQKEHPVFLSRK